MIGDALDPTTQPSLQKAYIDDYNSENRRVTLVICFIVFIVLCIFSMWDVLAFGIDHPKMGEIIFYRHLLGDPMLFYTAIYCFSHKRSFRLDRIWTVSMLLVCCSILVMYAFMYDIGFAPKIEGVLVFIVGCLFLPNIFYHQKLLVCSSTVMGYLLVLLLNDSEGTVFLHAGIYLSIITIAGTIHSVTFDRKSFSNFEKNTALNDLAHTDQLTGAENRHKFDENFQGLIERATREQKNIGLAIVDIDYFKKYNDHYGHLVGDQCLMKVAHALLSLREHLEDRCIRFGGEEFILIKYDLPADGLTAWANSIPKTISSLGILNEHGDVQGIVTASAGIRLWQPDLPLGRAELMSSADRALYQAKHQGRNRATIWQGK